MLVLNHNTVKLLLYNYSVYHPCIRLQTHYPLCNANILFALMHSDSHLFYSQKYLSDTEFVDVFKISREEFDKMAPWKQNDLKKNVSLY